MKISGIYSRTNDQGKTEIFVRIETTGKVLKITDTPIDQGDSCFISLTKISHFDLADNAIRKEIQSIEGQPQQEEDTRNYRFPRQR